MPHYLCYANIKPAMGQQDKKIIDGCIKGSDKAWKKFVRRFSGLVLWSAKSRLVKSGRTFTNNDLEDIHQEVFLSLYKNNNLSRLKNASKIAPWMAVLSGNIALNYIQRAKGRIAEKSVSLFEETHENESSAFTLGDALQAKTPHAAEQIDEKLKKEALDNAIESLNPKERLILNLYFVYENTVREISQNLNLAQGSVASIINRAKNKIKEDLRKKNIF